MKYRLSSNTLYLLIAAMIAVTGCGHKPDQSAASKTTPLPEVQAGVVTRATVQEVLPATGTLTTLQGREATLAPQVTGQLESLPVRLGEFVRQGQVVAGISTHQLAGQIQQAQATLGQNQVQVEQAEANALQQQAQTRASILQAQANLRNAQAALAAAQATLTGDVAALENARQNLAREQTLFQEGLVAQKDVEAAQLAVQTAAAQVSAQRQAIT
ncbi:MAG: biotin/lipoyl-binding protein, partial [Acetobacteraceae bacterium]|nr:biotin/lipoyl-binding protein [Acetobacteraceae bacterium]